MSQYSFAAPRPSAASSRRALRRRFPTTATTNTTATADDADEVVPLTPYLAAHVRRYHRWMGDAWLREMTSSEPLTLDEEYVMRDEWERSPVKHTFIIGDAAARATTRATRRAGGDDVVATTVTAAGIADATDVTTATSVNAAAAGCVVCAGKGRAGVPVAFKCMPCMCAILCKACAMKLATGGKCKACGHMFTGCKRVVVVAPPSSSSSSLSSSSSSSSSTVVVNGDAAAAADAGDVDGNAGADNSINADASDVDLIDGVINEPVCDGMVGDVNLFLRASHPLARHAAAAAADNATADAAVNNDTADDDDDVVAANNAATVKDVVGGDGGRVPVAEAYRVYGDNNSNDDDDNDDDDNDDDDNDDGAACAEHDNDGGDGAAVGEISVMVAESTSRCKGLGCVATLIFREPFVFAFVLF
jgi:hypothetical protein